MVDYKKNSRSKKKSSTATTTTTEQIQAEVMARIVGTFGSVENFQFVQRVLEEQARMEPYRKAMIAAQKQAHWQEKIENDLGSPIASIVSFDDACREALRHIKDHQDFLTSNGIDQRTKEDVDTFQRLQSEGAFNVLPLQVKTLLEVPPQPDAAIVMRAPAQGSQESQERTKTMEEDRAYQIETARLVERVKHEGEAARRAMWADQKAPKAGTGDDKRPIDKNKQLSDLLDDYEKRGNKTRAQFAEDRGLKLSNLKKRLGQATASRKENASNQYMSLVWANDRKVAKK